MIGSKLTQSIRYQRYLVGFGFQHQVNKLLFTTVTFNIEFSCDDLF